MGTRWWVANEPAVIRISLPYEVTRTVELGTQHACCSDTRSNFSLSTLGRPSDRTRVSSHDTQ